MKMLVSIIVFSLTSVVYSADVNFDGNKTNSPITKDISTVQVPEVKYGVPGEIRGRRERDCTRFTVGPSDNEIMTEKVSLRSDEYRTECYTYYVPGPNGQQIPQQHCYETLLETYRVKVQLNIKARKLFPWEKETFEACLEGPWTYLYQEEVGYKYKVEKKGYDDVLYILYPEYKIAMNPDSDGINYKEFSYNRDTKKYTFKLNDKWVNEYAGEKVKIKIELKKDISNWFDSSLGSKEYVFDVAPDYSIEFSENEIKKPENNISSDETYRSNEKLFETKGYYLKWGFSRIGKISKDKFIDKGETNRIQK